MPVAKIKPLIDELIPPNIPPNAKIRGQRTIKKMLGTPTDNPIKIPIIIYNERKIVIFLPILFINLIVIFCLNSFRVKNHSKFSVCSSNLS